MYTFLAIDKIEETETGSHVYVRISDSVAEQQKVFVFRNLPTEGEIEIEVARLLAYLNKQLVINNLDPNQIDPDNY